jgi:hypothetical protein
MMRDIGLSEEQARQAWNKGWDSASSLAEDALRELMSRVQYVPETKQYMLDEETVEALKDKMKSGLYKEMRVSQKAGLDYYFANAFDSKL